MGRARRRADKERMKKKARLFYPDQGDKAIKWADNLACCDCSACRNPRKESGKITLKEQLAEEYLQSFYVVRCKGC